MKEELFEFYYNTAKNIVKNFKNYGDKQIALLSCMETVCKLKHTFTSEQLLKFIELGNSEDTKEEG